MTKQKIVRAAPDDKFYASLKKARNHPAYYEDEIFMGKPTAYWIELDSHARKAGIEDVVLEKAKLRKRINILEKRWKALRKEITKVSKQPFGQDWIPATDVLDLMTEITRKIK